MRIKLGAGQQIKNKNGDIIGINVSAKTIKNKVSPPFRSCTFEIHFGKGIVEHEQVFDVLRKHGDVLTDKHEISFSGVGAWKTLAVTLRETGESIVEKKFYKADFIDVWNNPTYKPYIEAVLEDALITKMANKDDLDVDAESYEEVRAIALELNEEVLSPEE